VSLNWKEIDLILEELDLDGSYLQRIIQPDFTTLVFELYRRSGPYSVLVSLKNARTRIHRRSRSVRKPPKRQRFAQLLHSRLKGARIERVTHVNHDRIIRVDLIRAERESVLWIRLWGAAANIVLTEPDGVIVDAFYRRPKRNEVSGAHFWVEDTEGVPAKPVDIRPFDPASGLNTAVERHYDSLEQRENREQLLKSARKTLQRRVNALERRISSLQHGATGDPDTLQHCGELILANLHRIHPGEDRLDADDYAEPGTTRVIALEPELSAHHNAERYFDLAKKERRRIVAREEEQQNLLAQLTEAAAQLEALEETDDEQLLGLAESRSAERAEPEQTVGLRFESGSFRILVGRNARENDALLRRHVRGNDLWLHTRDHPGGYVFVRVPKGKSVPLETLLDAGNLAVHFSKAKSNGVADLYYTQVKYLRRAKDAPRGTVLPTQEKNLHIELDDRRIARLLGR
jgi:predicted ribosome quality control (RQC) complex YloA/Tae2 family protein